MPSSPKVLYIFSFIRAIKIKWQFYIKK